MKIEEQIVLVTGGARGLGAAISQAFLREGATVIINYHQSQDKAEALAQQANGKALAIQADINNKVEVEALFSQAKAHFGKAITTIVNNALPAFSFNGDERPFLETIAWQNFQQQIEGILNGALNTTQAGLEDMKAMQFGRIINIGTNLFQNPVVPYHDYTAAKAALLSFTRTSAQELGRYGITSNMLSGGLLKTTDASSATPEAVFDIIAANTPLGEVVTPEAFADAILYFAHPWSRAITGQNIIVDGGLVKN